MFTVNGWERLTGKALEKASRVVAPHTPEYAKKFGRKTVFLYDGGVIRLYAVGEGRIWSMKVYSNPDGAAQVLVQWASKPDLKNLTNRSWMKRNGFEDVYMNGETIY